VLPEKLVHRELTRRLVRPPAKQVRAMPEAVAGEMVVLNFDDQLGLQVQPLAAKAKRFPHVLCVGTRKS
jgi:hypothetical protein